MFNRIINCAIYLCNALTSDRSTSTDSRLDSMEQKLASIERELSDINARFGEIGGKIDKGQLAAWFYFGYSTGLAAMIVGATLAVGDPNRFWSWIAVFFIGAAVSVASIVRLYCKGKKR